MYTPALLERTAPLYDRVKTLIPPMEWPIRMTEVGSAKPGASTASPTWLAIA